MARGRCRYYRRHREWLRLALATHWRRSAKAPVGKYPDLCRLGGARFRCRDHRHRVDRGPGAMSQLLNIVLALPFLGFLLLLLFPKENRGAIRSACLGISLVVFLLSLGLLGPFLSNGPGTYFETDVEWIAYPPIRYHVQ